MEKTVLWHRAYSHRREWKQQMWTIRLMKAQQFRSYSPDMLGHTDRQTDQMTYIWRGLDQKGRIPGHRQSMQGYILTDYKPEREKFPQPQYVSLNRREGKTGRKSEENELSAAGSKSKLWQYLHFQHSLELCDISISQETNEVVHEGLGWIMGRHHNLEKNITVCL